MSRVMLNITKALEEADTSPQSVGFDFRLDLADIVLAQLKAKGWTQKRLAKESGFKESFISRIIHAESNCTFDVAGRILSALGLGGKLVTKISLPGNTVGLHNIGSAYYGQEISTKENKIRSKTISSHQTTTVAESPNMD